MATITIYLRSLKGTENRLYMRDTKGNEAINDLETVVEKGGGSTVTWELEKNSGIKGISRIWVRDDKPEGKVFKYEPKKQLLKKVHQVDLVKSDIELREKYYIKYIIDDGTEMIIDPFIRIPPPR
jgi:hypothetical protein